MRYVLGLLFVGALLTSCAVGSRPSKLRMVGDGMLPSLGPGDVLRVGTKGSTQVDNLKRWDVVCFLHPEDSSIAVRRLVGLPGEKITLLQDQITVDDSVLAIPSFLVSQYRDLLHPPHYHNHASARSYQLSTDEVFVLGDNAQRSYDSRHYGPIAITNVVGQVVAVNGTPLAGGI